jgi:hypothetical protein
MKKVVTLFTGAFRKERLEWPVRSPVNFAKAAGSTKPPFKKSAGLV